MGYYDLIFVPNVKLLEKEFRIRFDRKFTKTVKEIKSEMKVLLKAFDKTKRKHEKSYTISNDIDMLEQKLEDEYEKSAYYAQVSRTKYVNPNINKIQKQVEKKLKEMNEVMKNFHKVKSAELKARESVKSLQDKMVDSLVEQLKTKGKEDFKVLDDFEARRTLLRYSEMYKLVIPLKFWEENGFDICLPKVQILKFYV